MKLFRIPNTPPPVRPRDLAHCRITDVLQKTATDYMNVAAWLQEEAERDQHPLKDECHLCYASRTVASAKAKHLRNLHVQRTEGRSRPVSDRVFKELQVGNTASVRATHSETLAVEPALQQLANEISAAPLQSEFSAQKRLRRLASTYLRLFEGVKELDPFAAYEPGDLDPEFSTAWKRSFLRHHHAAKRFLDQVVANFEEKKPKSKSPRRNHEVRIVELGEVWVDGKESKLNRARKAALFTLAILRTATIGIKDFALLYNDKLNGDSERKANHANITKDALRGLQRSLPHLRVNIVSPGHRSVSGIEITCRVSKRDLKVWLSERRA